MTQYTPDFTGAVKKFDNRVFLRTCDHTICNNICTLQTVFFNLALIFFLLNVYILIIFHNYCLYFCNTVSIYNVFYHK